MFVYYDHYQVIVITEINWTILHFKSQQLGREEAPLFEWIWMTQGAVLIPTPFALFLNDLENLLDGGSIQMEIYVFRLSYADYLAVLAFCPQLYEG